MEEKMWEYFVETMTPYINQYQLVSIKSQQKLSKEAVEDILIQSVLGVETSKVRAIHILFIVHLLWKKF